RGFGNQDRREAPAGHVIIVEQRLRGGAVKVDAAVEGGDADEDRAGFRRTAPSEHGIDPFQRTAPQMGRYPEIRPDPRAHRPALFNARTLHGFPLSPVPPSA